MLGRQIETVENPQNVGAMGAAVIMAIGLGIKQSVVDTGSLIKALYHDNKRTFKKLNQ